LSRKSYKIFAKIEDLKTYLDKNKDKSCEFMKPIYIREEFLNFPNTQVKFLNKEEIELYLIEQKNGI